MAVGYGTGLQGALESVIAFGIWHPEITKRHNVASIVKTAVIVVVRHAKVFSLLI